MRVLVVAGEASGDLHAANLLQALRAAGGGVEAFGVNSLLWYVSTSFLVKRIYGLYIITPFKKIKLYTHSNINVTFITKKSPADRVVGAGPRACPKES